MNPKIWGPKLWFGLHSITLNYPKNPNIHDKKYMNDFFVSLQNVLPCKACAKNYESHLEKYPIKPALASRNDLVLWLIRIHNEVNKTLGKEIINEKKALQQIISQYNKEGIWSKVKRYKLHIIILFVLVILYIIKRKYKFNILKGNNKFIKQIGGKNIYANYYRYNY